MENPERHLKRSLEELASVLSSSKGAASKKTAKRAVIALLLIGALGVGAFFILRPKPVPVVSSPVAYQRYGPISETSYRTAGTVDYAVTSLLRSLSVTPMVTLDVTTGQRVAKGQRLAQFRDTELQIRLEGVLDQLDIQKDLLERGRRRVEIGSESEEAILLMEAELQDLLNRRNLIRQQISEQRLTAPFNGKILRIDLSVGEIPATGVMLLGSSDSVMVRSDIPQDDRARIRLGQPAIVILDAYPEMQYAGNVVDLMPLGDQARNTFEARVHILDPDSTIMPGYSARVYFTPLPLLVNKPVETRLAIDTMFVTVETDVTLMNGIETVRLESGSPFLDTVSPVPNVNVDFSRQEVTSDSEETMSVTFGRIWVVENGRAAPLIVKLGEVFGPYIEILDGLDEGQMVIRSEDEPLRRGLRVRLR